MAIRRQAVIKSGRIWMLRRHPVIDAVASNDMLVRLATRTDAAGLTASEHQCAAMQVDQCAMSIKLPVASRHGSLLVRLQLSRLWTANSRQDLCRGGVMRIYCGFYINPAGKVLRRRAFHTAH